MDALDNKNFAYKTFINNGYENEKPLYTINRAGIGMVGCEFCIKRDSTYPYNNIHIVKKGTGIVEYKNTEYAVSEGQLFILNSYEGHKYKSNSSDGMELIWIEFFDGDSGYFTKAIIENASPVFTTPNIVKMSNYINRILNLLIKDKDKNKYLVSRIIYSILVGLFEFSRNNIRIDLPVTEHRAVKNIVNYIDLNLCDNLEVEKLAEVAHFSTDYFSKMFIKVTGESPAKYVRKRRIAKAKDLLSEETAQIDEIANKLGFCDSSHFIKTFKKAEGLTPAEFRKQSKLYNI